MQVTNNLNTLLNTLLAMLASLGSDTLPDLILRAAIGAGVGYLTTLGLKTLIQWLKKRGRGKGP